MRISYPPPWESGYGGLTFVDICAPYIMPRLFHAFGPLLKLELLPQRPFLPLTSWKTPIHPLKPHSDPTASEKLS